MTDSRASSPAISCHQRVTTEEMQNVVDNLLASFTMEWTAPLPFHIETVVGPSGNEIVSAHGGFLCPDILQYLRPEFLGFKVFFPISMYNPGNGFALDANDQSPTAWDRLRKDQCRATIQNGGFHLICNGGYCSTRSPTSRKLICQHARNYQRNMSYNGPGRQPSAPETYRNSSFVNDRAKNSRGSAGNKMARRTSTARPRTAGCNCQFRITIQCDTHKGFYIHNCRRSPGILKHTNHMRLDPGQKSYPTRLVPSELLDTLRTLNSVHACNGIGRDLVFKKHNTVLSLQQLRYLQGFSSQACRPECDGAKDGAQESSLSSADKLIRQLCSSDRNYVCILRHSAAIGVPGENKDPQSVLRGCDHDEEKTRKFCLINGCITATAGNDSHDVITEDHGNRKMTEVSLDKTEFSEMSTFAEEKRMAQQCTDDQQLLIGIAWVSRSANRWFRLFPHVLFIDVTEDTNKESRPFLTVSVKDSSGHHHVVLRAFLPNQRAWSFRWVFQSVMPKLLDSRRLQNVNMCLTDGDSQETSQLDAAIQKFFPQALRRRCAYHMITKRWEKSTIKKRVPQGLSCNKSDRATVMKLLRDWQYSWSDSQTETLSEMRVTVALFMEYIQSVSIAKYATKEDIDEIFRLTRESILPFEEYFGFYRFSSVRCYDARTTSGHEGTNMALKQGSTSVRLNQALETAVAIIEQKEQNSDACCKIKDAHQQVKCKLWTDSVTSKYLNNMGECLLAKQKRLAELDDWITRRVAAKNTLGPVFHVAKRRFNNQGTAQQEDEHEQEGYYCHETVQVGPTSPIPVFHRVRTVHVEGGIMFCSCRYFERFGIPCRHIFVVISLVNPQHQITHHDVSVSYWSSYSLFAYDDASTCDKKDLCCALTQLSQADITGPKYPVETEGISTCDAAMLPFELIPRNAASSVLNWRLSEVRKAISKNNTEQPQCNEIVLSQVNGDDSVSIGDNSSCCFERNNEDATRFAPSLVEGATKSGGNAYQKIVPLAKDLAKRIDNGGFDDMITPLLVEALRSAEMRLSIVEAAACSPTTTNGVGNYVSCHAATHKRRKTTHSRWA